MCTRCDCELHRKGCFFLVFSLGLLHLVHADPAIPSANGYIQFRQVVFSQVCFRNCVFGILTPTTQEESSWVSKGSKNV